MKAMFIEFWIKQGIFRHFPQIPYADFINESEKNLLPERPLPILIKNHVFAIVHFPT